MEKKYAFINNIYSNSEASEHDSVYEVVISSLDFLDISIYRTDIEGLRRLNEDATLIKDFCFDSSYLRCNCNILPCMNSVVKESINKEIRFTQDSVNSIFTLLLSGVKHGFSIIDDSLRDELNWTGNGIVRFNRIQFSQSSMSVYVRMAIGSNLKNKHIVKMDKGIIKIEPFCFIVPKADGIIPPFGQFIKDVTFNNKEYQMYEVTDADIFEELHIISPALINKAACSSEKLLSSINVLKEFLNILYEADDKKMTWVGEQGNKAVRCYGVKFKNSMKHLTKREALNFLEDFQPVLKRCGSLDVLRDEIASPNFSDLDRFLLNRLGFVLYQSENTAELILNLRTMLDYEYDKFFYANLFLYRTRIFLYVTRTSIAIGTPVLTGSNETQSYTIVEEDFYYDAW
jgi:hypothetical protein